MTPAYQDGTYEPLKPEFDLKESVFLVTDKDQQKRLVTGITFRETGILYALSFNGTETWHYSFEINTFNKPVEIGFNKYSKEGNES